MGARLLGEPLPVAGISAMDYGTYEGKAMIYAVASGKTCAMYMIDVESGECLRKMDLHGSSHTWGVSVAADGTVYAGGDGYFYRYIPGEDEAENLGRPIEGENYFWQTTVDEHGHPYCGTYPNGKVFRYEAKTKTFRDYGQIVDGENYVRSLSAANGKIYAGIGSKAHLIELDPQSGQKREIPLPEECQNSDFVYDLTAAYPKLFAYISNVLHVYDLEQGQWVARFEQTSSSVSAADEEGYVYLIYQGKLSRLHLETLELIQTDVQWGSAANLGWVELSSPDFPGKTLINMGSESYKLYNPVSGRSKEVKVELEGIPMGVQSLTAGSDGRIYIGGYFYGGFASYDPEKDQLTPCQRFGQTENMLEYKGKLYLGVYTGARIYEYDPNQAWEMNHNPALKFSLSDQGQDRPFAFADAGEYLAIGTVPGYGKLGGALTLYDPETDHYEVFRDVVPEQSVICLTHRDGIIFGGTSVWGGLGIKPTAEEAKLFLFDVKEKRKIWEGAPCPGEKAVSALCTDDQGFVWGLTRSSIFKFNPKTRVFELVQQWMSPPDWSKVPHFWRGEFIQFDPAGYLFGNFRNKLFRYDIAADRVEFFEEEVNLFARDRHGNAYYAKGTELYQYKFE